MSTIAFEKQIRDLEKMRERLYRGVQAVAPDLLTQKLAAEKWSVLEIVEHVILGEQYVLYGYKNDAGSAGMQAKPRSPFKITMVRTVLRFGIPVPAPSRSMVPQGSLKLPELHAQWLANHAWIKDFCSKLSNEDFDKPCFFHPVAGVLTVADALNLDRTHIASHTRQIEKILRVRSPI